MSESIGDISNPKWMYSTKAGNKLDLGCGEAWHTHHDRFGFEGIDIHDFGQVYVQDITEGLPVAPRSLDAIRSAHFFEHLTNAEAISVLNECHRALKQSAVMNIIVPSVKDHPGAFVLTHKSYWNESTFRDLEQYNRQFVFHINRWKVISMTTNGRGEIHCYMTPVYEKESK